MEEKKRKKSKKKNRSAQSESLHEVAASSSSTQKQDHHCATRDLDPPAENGDTPGAKEEEETLDPEAPASDPRLREELSAAQQIARELKNALESETANSHALRLLLEDLKTSHATSQTSSQLLLKQLREEMAQLRESESHQKGKEVGLQGEIQHLREENFQLRAVQEHQEQREAFAHTEVQQLREDNVQLREDSSQLFKEDESSVSVML